MKKFIGILVAACLVSLVAGLFLESYNRDAESGPFHMVNKTTDRLSREIRERFGDTFGDGNNIYFETTLIGLDAEPIRFPSTARWGIGGALAPFGDDIVVLRFDGTLLSVHPDGSWSELKVAVPENGFEAFEEAGEKPPYNKGYTFRPDRFRYNDILFYDGPLGRRILVSYTKYHPEKECFTNAVSQLVLPPNVSEASQIEASADDWSVLFETEPCLPFRQIEEAVMGEEAGGTLAVAPDGRSIYPST